VILTATVWPAPLPGGHVRFSLNGHTISGCRTIQTDPYGTAICHLVQHTVGKSRLKAAYLGDGRSAGSTSKQLIDQVRWGLRLHGHPSLRTTVLRMTLGCAPRSRGCRVLAALTTKSTTRRRSHGHVRRVRRPVTVASMTARIQAGRTRTLRAQVNARGRRLLAKHPHLQAKLTISLMLNKHRTTVTTRTLRNRPDIGRDRR